MRDPRFVMPWHKSDSELIEEGMRRDAKINKILAERAIHLTKNQRKKQRQRRLQ